MAKELAAGVSDFKYRPLAGSYPNVCLDAIYLKVRRGARVVSMTTLVAYAVNEDGEREVLGIDIADGEMTACSKAFLERLVERGLRGVQLVISDAHTGLKYAIRVVFVGSSWQRCRVHVMRNVLCRVPRAVQGLASEIFEHVFAEPSKKLAREAMGQAIELLAERYPKAAEVVRQAEEDVLAYMDFPEKHWRQLHSTNPLERLNKEVRRRTEVLVIFPNPESAVRLVAILLIEQHDEWAVVRRYFSKEFMVLLEPKLEELPDAA